MEYDGAWNLLLSQEEREKSDGSHRENWPPPYIGNGRIALLPSMADDRGVNIDRVLMTLDHDPEHAEAVHIMPPRKGKGMLMANAVEGFGCGTLRMFDRGKEADGDVRYVLKNARLSMDTGTYRSDYDIVQEGAVLATISCDAYACRQHPQLCVQNVSIRVRTDQRPDPQEDVMFHEMHAPSGSEQAARFGTSIVLARGGTDSMYVFSGSAPVAPSAVLATLTSSAARAAIAPLYCSASSSYTWDTGSAVQLGFARDETRPGTGFNKMLLRDASVVTDADTGVEYREYKFHLFCVSMTHLVSGGIASSLAPPEKESTHQLVTILGRNTSSSSVASVRIRSEHVKRWDALWATNVTPVSKLGITSEEEGRVLRVKRHMRYALYNIYASVRGEAMYNSAIASVGGISAIDMLGNVETAGEVWFVPLLTILKPDAMRAVLNARGTEASLTLAAQNAEDHGFQGLLFPFAQTLRVDAATFSADASGTGGVYWDSVAIVPVFHTAAIALNTWNYYRVTRDRDWLERNYSVLSGVADFCASVLVMEGSSDKRRELVGSVPFANGKKREGKKQNAFSTNLCFMALKAAIEASHELNKSVVREWSDALFDSEDVFFSGSSIANDVIQVDADYELNSAVFVAEPVLALTPTFSQDMFPVYGANEERFRRTVRRNRDHYVPAVASAADDGSLVAADLAINKVLFATATGFIAQDAEASVETTDAELDSFYDLIEEFVAVSAEPVWGNLMSMPTNKEDARRKQSVNTMHVNDLVTSSAYLSVILGACCGAQVVGGVTNTKYYYEDMRLRLARTRKLPRTWKELRVTKLAEARGRPGETVSITNDLVYNPQ